MKAQLFSVASETSFLTDLFGGLLANVPLWTLVLFCLGGFSFYRVISSIRLLNVKGALLGLVTSGLAVLAAVVLGNAFGLIESDHGGWCLVLAAVVILNSVWHLYSVRPKLEKEESKLGFDLAVVVGTAGMMMVGLTFVLDAKKEHEDEVYRARQAIVNVKWKAEREARDALLAAEKVAAEQAKAAFRAKFQPVIDSLPDRVYSADGTMYEQQVLVTQVGEDSWNGPYLVVINDEGQEQSYHVEEQQVALVLALRKIKAALEGGEYPVVTLKMEIVEARLDGFQRASLNGMSLSN